MKLSIFLVAVLMAACPPASAGTRGCVRAGVVMVELQGPARETKVNGKAIGPGRELDAVRESCATYLVVLLAPEATLGSLLDFGLVASKNGFDEKSGSYLAFAYSTDRSRMTYLKTMAVVRYSDDPEMLEKLAKNPPLVDDYL